MTIDHVGLRTKNLKKMAAFYAAALRPLGFVADASGTGFGPPGAPVLWLYELASSAGAAASSMHLALRAKDAATVDAFYAAAREHGGKDNGAPGLRADYSPTYYAAFVLDPDGNNLEVVTS